MSNSLTYLFGLSFWRSVNMLINYFLETDVLKTFNNEIPGTVHVAFVRISYKQCLRIYNQFLFAVVPRDAAKGK